jgi:hypothetical protein
MKRIKRDPNRQHDPQHAELPEANGRKQFIEGRGPEHVVFEEAQKTQVRHHASGDGQPLLGARGARARDDLSPDEIHHRREEHQAYEPRLPPPVKEIAGDRNPEVPEPERQEVADQQKERQKVEDEDMGREDHDSP